MQDDSDLKLDKPKFLDSDWFDNPNGKEYWHSRTPEERLIEVGRLRRVYYGEAVDKPMDKSFFKIVPIDWQ